MRWPADGVPPELYDLVVLDVASPTVEMSVAARAAASAVSSSGELVVLSPARLLTQAERARLRRLVERVPGEHHGATGAAGEAGHTGRIEVEIPPGFFLQDRRGLCGHLRDAAARIEEEGGHSPMSRALGRLLLYSEVCLIENGLLPPVTWLSIYTRAEPPARASRAGPSDIASAQATEIARLEKLVGAEVAHGTALAEELRRQGDNASRAAADLERLMREREILRGKGLSRYKGYLKERLSGRGR
jgi:hypothetical protein